MRLGLQTKGIKNTVDICDLTASHSGTHTHTHTKGERKKQREADRHVQCTHAGLFLLFEHHADCDLNKLDAVMLSVAMCTALFFCFGLYHEPRRIMSHFKLHVYLAAQLSFNRSERRPECHFEEI